MEEKLYQPLIFYVQIVLKKNLDLEIEEWKTPLMKTMLLHFIQSRKQKFVALSTIEAEYIASSVRRNVASQAYDRFTWSWDGFYDDN